jgi:diguanylate cyclase (GGDEF)-like protein/PAS domain S-box-containing protein
MPSTMKPLSLRLLTAHYVAALLIIAGVSFAFHLDASYNFRRDRNLALVINTAGRQRMLCQRIASLAAQYELGNRTARVALLAATAEFETKQNELAALNLRIRHPDAATLQVRAIYTGGAHPLDDVIRLFVADARAVAAAPPGAAAAAAPLAALFAEASAPLPLPLNTVVQIHQHETEDALAQLNGLQLSALIIIVLTLSAEAWFIFRLMARMVSNRIAHAQALVSRLAEQHEMLRVTLHSIGDGVITTDEAGLVTWLNPVAEYLTGWSTADAKGRPIVEIFPIYNQETRLPAENPVAICLAENRVAGLAANTILISRHGDEHGIEDSAAPIRKATGEVIGVVLVFHDVTDQRQLTGEMSFRATHDALTGLLNRPEFELRLLYLLHKAHSDRTQNVILFIDLDQFKLVNDTCGHAAGDQLLIQIAKLLSGVVRASDTVARLGGDEFAILLDQCPVEQAELVAQKLCDGLEEFRFTMNDQRFRIGASIGLVPVDQRWTVVSAIMNAADACCHAAKASGRNRVHKWSDSDEKIRTRHGEAQWATRLAQALDENRFVLFAQRIFRIGHENAPGIHAEVLLRMLELDGSLSQPGAFLPAAERFHLASRIDRWVLAKAIDWMKRLPALEGLDLLCINLSGQSVEDAAFHRWAIAILSEAGPRICQRICLEITETCAVTSLNEAALFIGRLRTIGVRVALDDFGAGASSFGYLKSMPVDFLKIDGQFVRDILTDRLDEAAVRCFADVAATVGMQTIAEFTDSAAVLKRLQAMGIDFAQGFYLHKPAPIDELARPAMVDAGSTDRV